MQEFGEEAEGEEFEAAAAALHGFLDARAQRAWAAACRYLSSAVVSLAEGAAKRSGQPEASCAAGLQALTLPAAIPQLRAEARSADVGSLRAEGERGFLLYRAAEGVFAISVAQEGGEWKVATLAGLQLS